MTRTLHTPLTKFALSVSMIVAIVFANTVQAETIRVPQGAEASYVELPQRGISKASLVNQFGEPISEHGPRGEPPIYFWEYGDFTVYFEGDYVIHAVNKHQSQIKKVQ